jgi:hypothetical protein
MSSAAAPTEADRIALNNMFRAIAEYGRKVRLRRLAESSQSAGEKGGHDQPEEEPEDRVPAN